MRAENCLIHVLRMFADRSETIKPGNTSFIYWVENSESYLSFGEDEMETSEIVQIGDMTSQPDYESQDWQFEGATWMINLWLPKKVQSMVLQKLTHQHQKSMGSMYLFLLANDLRKLSLMKSQ